MAAKSKTSSKSVASKMFKRSDRVTWNSEAGWVTGIIQKKITSPMIFKGYTRHASKDQPQYIIKSEKTDHIAIHKGSALAKLPKKAPAKRAPKTKKPTSRQSRRSD